MQEQESTQNQLQTEEILINVAPKKKRIVTKKGKTGDNVSSPIISLANVEMCKTVNNAAATSKESNGKESNGKEPDSNININVNVNINIIVNVNININVDILINEYFIDFIDFDITIFCISTV